MDALPAEIKLEILKLADYTTLGFIVRASPSYYAVYCQSRQTILNAAVSDHIVEQKFNTQLPSQWQLSHTSQGIFGKLPLPNHRYVFEICTSRRIDDDMTAFKDAILALYHEIEVQHGKPLRLRLSIAHCISLLEINILHCTYYGQDEIRRSHAPAIWGGHSFNENRGTWPNRCERTHRRMCVEQDGTLRTFCSDFDANAVHSAYYSFPEGPGKAFQ